MAGSYEAMKYTVLLILSGLESVVWNRVITIAKEKKIDVEQTGNEA